MGCVKIRGILHTRACIKKGTREAYRRARLHLINFSRGARRGGEGACVQCVPQFVPKLLP